MMIECYSEFWSNNQELAARAREAKSALRKVVLQELPVIRQNMEGIQPACPQVEV